jgi:hypothetical protein
MRVHEEARRSEEVMMRTLEANIAEARRSEENLFLPENQGICECDPRTSNGLLKWVLSRHCPPYYDKLMVE